MFSLHFDKGNAVTLMYNNQILFHNISLLLHESGGKYVRQALSRVNDPGGKGVEAQAFSVENDISAGELYFNYGANTIALCMKAYMKPIEPKFEKQHTFSGEAAILSGAFPNGFSGTAVYQHKSWWCRPAFPETRELIL